GGEQAYDRRVETRTSGIAPILVVDTIAAIGAEPDSVHGVAPVGADFDREPPIRVIGAFVDQSVRRLIGAELVVIDLLIPIDLEQRISARGRLGVAAIEKPRSVVRPRRAGKLDPLQVIAAVLL